MRGISTLIGFGGVSGAGKSSTTLAIARGMAETGARVIIVDAGEGEEVFSRALGVADLTLDVDPSQGECRALMSPVPGLQIVPRTLWARLAALPDEALFRQLHGLQADAVIVDVAPDQCARVMEAMDLRVMIVPGDQDPEPSRRLFEQVVRRICDGVVQDEREAAELERAWPQLASVADASLREALLRNMRFAGFRTFVNRAGDTLIREQIRELAADFAETFEVDIATRLELGRDPVLAKVLSGRPIEEHNPEGAAFGQALAATDVGFLRQQRRRSDSGERASARPPLVNLIRTQERLRRPHACRARYAGREVGGWVIDASVGGVLLRLPYDIEPGTRARLTVGSLRDLHAVVVRSEGGRVAFTLRDLHFAHELLRVLEQAYESSRAELGA